ncbi:RHS repeat domain-containing protein [Reichenbachiella ulvae]|uniref:RHS repeat protein n=1 Tax=Reichenbachiella ulvae TaxID=2980104 RepID=A0ABT3CUV6_9BACT|nr:RHS repeat domain-containing protein [Reichenbachiella ulvae]MCV9387476.1 RHS repeat protein [Reichenbachiella ulvae]
MNPVNSDDSLTHVFSYEETHLLPGKTSFAKDFWGYFNGQENSSNLYGNQHSLLPNPEVMQYLESDFGNVDWDGYYANFYDLQFANRFTDGEYLKTGTLKSITYPTGGRTEFEFEPHDFYNKEMFSASEQSLFIPDKVAHSVTDFNEPAGYPSMSVLSVPFTLEELTEVNIKGGVNISGNYDFSSSNIGIVDLSGGANSHMYNLGQQSTWDETFELPAGSYRLVCGAPSNIPFQNYQPIVYANLKYHEYDREAMDSVLNISGGIGGGLRVKTVTNYDEQNQIVLKKDYSYVDEDGVSSGRLLRTMDNFQTVTITTGYYDDRGIDGWYTSTQMIDAFSFFSNNFLSMHNANSQANVGYDRVIVREVNGTENLGESISYFVNESPSQIANYFNLYYTSTNGTLKEYIILDSDLDTVQYVKNQYHVVDFTRNMLNIKAVDTYYGPRSGYCAIECILADGTKGMYDVVVFGYTSFLNQLVSTETIEYAGGDRLITTVSHRYDDFNYLLDQVSRMVNHDQERVTTFKYPHDYPNDIIYSSLIDDNIISPVIIQSEFLDNELLKTQRNSWKFYDGGSILASYDVKIAFGERDLEQKIVFDDYDLLGNVLQYHKPNEDINTVLFRGYGDNRVVAKIVGEKDYDQVATSAGSYLVQLDDQLTESQLRTVNVSIRNALPNSMVTTYTYDPLVGMTSQTDPNGRTTYYEYDDFGRLERVIDDEGNPVSAYEYNYKNQ